MENQGSPGTQRASELLRIGVDPTVASYFSQFNSLIEGLEGVNTTTDLESAHYLISRSEQKFRLLKSQNILYECLQFNEFIHNVALFIKDLKPRPTLEKNPPPMDLIEIFNRKINIPHKDLNETLSLCRLKKLLDTKASGLFDTLRVLLGGELLEGYQSFQLLVHEKGRSNIRSFSLQNEKEDKFLTNKVELFNELYRSIKKSKHKKFELKGKSKDLLSVIGTYQARSIETSTHRVIFIVSRNGFLPPSDREVKLFNDLSEVLIPHLEKILYQDKQVRKGITLEEICKGMPFPFALNCRSQSIITNDLYLSLQNDDLQKLNKVEVTPFCEIDYTPPFSHFFESDILHHQRVRLLGELLNTLSHELSNPLFGLSLASEILKGETQDQEVSDIVDDIKNNTQRCQKIIDNFNYLYDSKNQYESIYLKTLLEETIKLTKSATKGIKKFLTYSDELTDLDLTFSVNPTSLSQIIFNLIINASQAIREVKEDKDGEINIHVDKGAQGEVIITISDNGPGLPGDKTENIFQPFYTTKEEGTGLGLTICQSLAQKIGAQLNAKNRETCQGAQFILQLPPKGKL